MIEAIQAINPEVTTAELFVDCLTIRQHLAAQAMQGLLAGRAFGDALAVNYREKIATEAVGLADALLRRLGEEGK